MDFLSEKLGIKDIKNNFMNMINDFNNLDKDKFFNEEEKKEQNKNDENNDNENNENENKENNNKNNDNENENKNENNNETNENNNESEENNDNKSNSSEDELNKIIETKETIIENPPSNTKTFKLNSNITNNEYRITFENQTEKLY